MTQGRLRVRLVRTPEDLAEVQDLRWRAFRKESGGRDADRFDALCDHLLVEDRQGGRPLATCRLRTMASGAEIGQSYAAQFYDLSGLSQRADPMIEIGRLCADPGRSDPEILMTLWSALARRVLDAGAAMLIGCASFRGTDVAAYGAAFALLGAHHLAPEAWRPGQRAGQVVPLAGPAEAEDRPLALRQMPPLLRSYLAMGARVSDHAVIDEDMGTLHVFVGVEVAAIPAARARTLRALAA